MKDTFLRLEVKLPDKLSVTDTVLLIRSYLRGMDVQFVGSRTETEKVNDSKR